jgi:hypothetical protein
MPTTDPTTVPTSMTADHLHAAEPQFEVVWPLSPRRVERIATVEAVGGLDGKRVAFIWNFLFKGPTMWGYLSEELAKRYPGVEFVDYSEFGNIHGDEEVELVAALPEKLKRLEVDAAVVGVGACGSCTPAVMRAVAKVAEAGLPSVAIVANQFQRQARMIARAQGLDSCTIAVYPGTILVDDDETFASNTMQHVFPFVLDGLTGLRTDSAAGAETASAAGTAAAVSVMAAPTSGTAAPTAPATATAALADAAESEHGADEIVYRGTLQDVQDEFVARQWSDGLPIVPPTRRLVEAFVEASGRVGSDVLGLMQPSNREATIWSIATNAVMAGCRAEYMPLLVALVEGLCDPYFRVQDAGGTPGWEPLVIVSGPVVEKLGFNTGAGALRIGNQANSSIGRFTRLYLRNIPGLLPGATDQGSFGFNFNIAMAENGAALAEMGWPTVAQDEGFAAGTSTVTIQSVVTISSSLPSSGSTAEENLYYIAPALCQAIAVGGVFAQYNHSILYTVLAMCPPIARTIAKDGWSKDDVRRYLGDHMTMNGGLVNERAFGGSGGHKFAIERTPFGIDFLRRQGLDPATVDVSQVDFPALVSVEKMAITAVGNPGRNHSRAFIGNHVQGARVTKAIHNP